MEIENAAQFGNRYVFASNDSFSDRKLTINRNFGVNSFRGDIDRYHVQGFIQDEQKFSLSLSDEDMLDLFRAYLTMKAEYDAE